MTRESDPRAVAEALHSAALRLLRRLRRTDAAATGLTPAKASALSVLTFAGPQTLTALAEAEQVRAPTMSRLVEAMAAEGLVAKTAGPDDARVRVVAATARGRKLLLQGRAARLKTLARDVAALGPEERAVLARAAALMRGLANPTE